MLLTDLTGEQMIMLIIPALPNMWALKHAMYHDFPTPREKTRWMMACVFLPCIGGLAYYFVGRKHAGKKEPDIFDAAGKGAEAASAAPEASAPSAGPELPEQAGGLSSAEAPAPAPHAHAESGPAGDGWSFGCPDDAGNGKR